MSRGKFGFTTETQGHREVFLGVFGAVGVVGSREMLGADGRVEWECLCWRVAALVGLGEGDGRSHGPGIVRPESCPLYQGRFAASLAMASLGAVPRKATP